jgi:hypothetical protein
MFFGTNTMTVIINDESTINGTDTMTCVIDFESSLVFANYTLIVDIQSCTWWTYTISEIITILVWWTCVN